MKNLKIKLLELKIRYDLLLLGFIIIAYFFYLRVLINRLPKELWFYNGDRIIDYKLLFSVLLSIIICTYILIIHTLLFFNIPITPGALIIKFNNITTKALHEVFNSTSIFFKNGYESLANTIKIFYTFFSKYPEYTLFFISYFVRIFLLILFLIDVFYFFKLEYFYKFIIFLCIPICIRIWLYILEDFSENLEFLKSILIIKDGGIDPESQEPITYFTLVPEYKSLNLNYYKNQYILTLKVTGYLYYCNAYKKFFDPKINIIIYSGYLIGWLYILLTNLL